MANCAEADGGVHITIPEAVNEGGVTFYNIKIKVESSRFSNLSNVDSGKGQEDGVEWTIKKRYNDFSDLHTALVEFGVAKDSLPQKKLLGNRDPTFIMKRRRELETYIQSAFKFLERAVPDALATFLHLDVYDVNFLLREMAAEHYDRVEAAAQAESGTGMTESAKWSPLNLFSISERLRSALPARDCEDKRHDFTNVADMACQLQALLVQGSDTPLGASNIIPNRLKFDFLAFRSLTKLILLEVDCGPDTILALGMVRETLTYLRVNKCGLRSVAQVLLCDSAHDAFDECSLRSTVEAGGAQLQWKRLETLDLRYNSIEKIDCSTAVAPHLTSLLLGSNSISAIENLACLSKLSVLELADNCVSDTDSLNTRLGQIGSIDLSQNKVTSLAGFSKLYSLRHLNLAGNRIKDLDSVLPIASLPCLESLNLQGNMVTTVVDYRLKVFEFFGKRCAELCLDNETPSQPEVDKVSVLMALRVAKCGGTLFGNLPRV